MSEWDYKIPTSIPTVTPRERPVIYLPDGREITVRPPVGFANHPAVPKRLP